MCGIWCCISTESCNSCKASVSNNLRPKWQDSKQGSDCSVYYNENSKNAEFISRRGPDASSTMCFKVSNNSAMQEIFAHLASHVLWTQGEKVQTQPYRNEDNNRFMIFNGDIYSFLGFDGDDKTTLVNPNMSESLENDGLKLFKLLEQCDNELEMCRIIENLQGPFAFVLLDISRGCLWFVRDFFGQESLLFSHGENEDTGNVNTWTISSVSVFKTVFEIPSSGLFCLTIESKELTLYPYSHLRESVSTLNKQFFSMLQSYGIIKTVVIATANINLHFSSQVKLPEAVLDNELLNSILKEAKSVESPQDFLKSTLYTLSWHSDSLIDVLRRSVRRRIFTLPPFCKNCMELCKGISLSSGETCNHSKVGVLFSGGLDSTVLAYLAAEALPQGSSLDLINVGFSKDGNFTNIPDRVTALASYKMLNERFKPQGKFIRLVLVNIGKKEVEEQRRERIKHLISPLNSVLDDSLGVCLWFAARGIGKLYDETDRNSWSENYKSPIRVVLLGSGADELLGGYGRHRSAYEKSGWEGLRSEMQLDFDRISIRNMGRDNRIVSDHGICPRIPFLDEHVVDFLTKHCDLWVKCCPVNMGPLGSRGSGEKLLLRSVGAKLFGEQYFSLALFPKRAMQFGSKIAKLENSKEKGGDSCQRLL